MRQLLNIDLVAPGRRGLNLQQKGTVLSPEWATRALNCVLDDAKRLSCREGYSVTTTTAISPAVTIKSIHEYLEGDGSVEVILSYDGGISNSITDPAGSDISGAVVDTNGKWRFHNFNNKVIGFQAGSKPIVYSGTSFAVVSESSGTAPTCFACIGICAYGRVWAVDSDGQTIKYSGLLDETDWGGAGAGQIDMSSVWPGGMDVVSGLAAFNGSLVVFGKNHIVIYDDNIGSSIGVDPNNLMVADVIQGTGCVSQCTVQKVGNSDIVFLSRNGVQSLQRVVLQKSNPLENVSKYVRDDMMELVNEAGFGNIQSAYSPDKGLYFLTVPAASNSLTWVFDVKNAFQDEEGSLIFPCTTWDLVPSYICVRQSGTILLGSDDGEIWTLGADSDDSVPIRYEWHSPWLDLGQELSNRLKLLKKVGAIVFTRANSEVFFSWAKDFNEEELDTVAIVLDGDAVSEWNVAEWGLAEWAGALSLKIVDVNGRASAHYYKFKVESDTQEGFALQQFEIYCKIGRMA